MDIFTFIDSTAVLTPYFRRFAEKGMEFSTMAPGEVLQHLRYPGRCAEAAMLEMTKGVNSHKGIIFSMGVICTAMGMLYGQGKTLTADEILDLSGEICSSLMDDFKQMNVPRSYGEKLYAEHGISGIRGEASQGYPTVRNVGLPAMRKYLNQGMSLNDAGAWTLLELLSATEDSNIITRSDVETLRSVQQQVREALNKNDRSEELLNELDSEFIAKNISPGGCADLLALTYFLYFTEQ
jgi:holo-ACP synthase/triphosphoribosyl-dephospho-CoA synthase